jgi:hypothetical protein
MINTRGRAAHGVTHADIVLDMTDPVNPMALG